MGTAIYTNGKMILYMYMSISILQNRLVSTMLTLVLMPTGNNDMIPPHGLPPPNHEIVTEFESLTGKVKLKEYKERNSIINEFWVEVYVVGRKVYELNMSFNAERYTDEPFSKNIWRKASEDEIDHLIIEGKMVCVGNT